MFNNTPPKIYVSKILDAEINAIPRSAIELTSGVDGYIVNDAIDGLSRPDADISISALAGANASRISGSHINERNIVFSIIPIPNTDFARECLYYNLPFNTMLRFYFVRHKKAVFIDGYIEKLSGAFKPGKPFVFTVSVLCPFPWFQSVELHSMALVVGENTLKYNGDIPAGFTLTVPAQKHPPVLGSVEDLSLTIGGKTFAYEGTISIPTICTIPGSKSFTGVRRIIGNLRAPAFGALKNGSEWVTISWENKTMTVSCSDATKSFFEQQNVLTWRDTYSGV